MASKTQGVLILLLCSTMFAQNLAVEFSQAILNFMGVYNGLFDNSDQVQKNPTAFDLLRLKVTPVEIPALRGKPVLYMKQSINGAVVRLQLVELVDGGDKVIHAIPYHLRIDTFDVETIYRLRTEDLKTNTACKGTVTVISSKEFEMRWPNCVQGRLLGPGTYSTRLTCTYASYSPPVNAPEKIPANDPYKVELKGPRYPVPGAPKGFKRPCG